MVYWISFPPSWKLPDVQAGLNVVITFLCAGCIFVLVRYCWQLAARRVAAQKDVPAYTLLSLNTIGEAVDIIWLLRKDLFATRYHGLLVQCLFVVLLTCATLSSGFIARVSTRYGNIVVQQLTNGTIAERSTGSLLYAEIDTNTTLFNLQRANFTTDQLLDYLPAQDSNWDYIPTQWNNSWAMDCTYAPVTEIAKVRATGNCSENMWTEIPQSWQLWTQMSGFNKNWSISYDRTGWRSNRTAFRDILMFMHGIYLDPTKYDNHLNTSTTADIRTIALHLEGVPYNISLPSGCTFSTGPVTRASYTDFRCKLTRKTGVFKTADDAYYGAYPEGYDITAIASAYSGHWANNFRKESARDITTTVITGPEMAQFYQAYLITKDTTISPNVFRLMNVTLRVAQISIITLVCCCVGAFLVILGLAHYLFFVWRHWHRLDKTPQSKLDWMLQTIRNENTGLQPIADGTGNANGEGMSLREKLRHSRAFGGDGSKTDTIPLTHANTNYYANVNNDPKNTITSTTTHITGPSPDPFDDTFERNSIHSRHSRHSLTDFSGSGSVYSRQTYGFEPQSQSQPQAYVQSPPQSQGSVAGRMQSWMPYMPQNSYAPIGVGGGGGGGNGGQGYVQSPYVVQGLGVGFGQDHTAGHDPYNTAYDPGRR